MAFNVVADQLIAFVATVPLRVVPDAVVGTFENQASVIKHALAEGLGLGEGVEILLGPIATTESALSAGPVCNANAGRIVLAFLDLIDIE